MSRKLTLSDIADLREYERERDEFRTHVIALKKRRRIGVGPIITLLFENRDTIRFQIQEMARVERILTDEGIQTVCIVPLRSRGTSIGVLGLYHDTDRSWPDEEVALVQASPGYAQHQDERLLTQGLLTRRRLPVGGLRVPARRRPGRRCAAWSGAVGARSRAGRPPGRARAPTRGGVHTEARGVGRIDGRADAPRGNTAGRGARREACGVVAEAAAKRIGVGERPG